MRRSESSFLRPVACSAIVTVLLAGVMLVWAAPPASAGSVIDAINGARAERGLAPLAHFGEDTVVREANDSFVESGREHGTVSEAAQWYFDRGASAFRENQAILPDSIASPSSVVQVWLASEEHAANLLAPEVTHVAAASRSSGDRTFYTVHLLVGGPDPAPPPPPPPPPEPAPEPPEATPPPPAEPPAAEPTSDAGAATAADEPPPEPSDVREERDLSALRAPVPDITSGDAEHADGTTLRGVELADLRIRLRAERLPGQPNVQEVEVAGRTYERLAHGAASTDDATVPLLGLVPGALVLAALAVATRRRRSRGSAHSAGGGSLT